MKLYLIECNIPCNKFSSFIVKANNKKEAFDKVWNNYIKPINDLSNEYNNFYKSDFSIKDIEKECFKDNDIYTC